MPFVEILRQQRVKITENYRILRAKEASNPQKTAECVQMKEKLQRKIDEYGRLSATAHDIHGFQKVVALGNKILANIIQLIEYY